MEYYHHHLSANSRKCIKMFIRICQAETSLVYAHVQMLDTIVKIIANGFAMLSSIEKSVSKKVTFV